MLDRILITNDDGIEAPGLIVLEQIAGEHRSNPLLAVQCHVDREVDAGHPRDFTHVVVNRIAFGDAPGGVRMADARGGVYFSVTGAKDSGVFYADPTGVVSQYGKDVPLANGIILSPDEKTLYVTNGAVVFAFDVKPDGALANQREFGKLEGGEGGDGSAVDQQGRVYVATGKSVDVFAPDGKFVGSIPGPQGLHGTFFGGRDKRTLFGIVFYGAWGTPSARNSIISIPTIAQGYTGRAK